MILMRVIAPPFSTETNTETTSQGNKFQKINGNKNKDMIIVDDYEDL